LINVEFFMLGLVQLEAMVIPLTGRAQCAPTAGADAYETKPKKHCQQHWMTWFTSSLLLAVHPDSRQSGNE
jgi:hypothetical protein